MYKHSWSDGETRSGTSFLSCAFCGLTLTLRTARLKWRDLFFSECKGPRKPKRKTLADR